MLGKEKKVTQFDTLISERSEVVGDLKISGGLHIDGKIKGNINADADSGAVVRISDKGQVEGEIRAPHIIINGQVTGDVYSFQHIELAKKAHVNGDLYYSMMEMVMGAKVSGKVVHQEKVETSKVTSFKAKAAGDHTSAETE
ncbi:bactofilin family protein [Salinibius halmophilus]|uniref:bactofilin family protein n=1 Tax=Salinibius halmophilus TaxID=1853216 RepID=UPI000E664A2B|nr:polymer-forming cytoskeletal protein [Salinibius halmophilus]